MWNLLFASLWCFCFYSWCCFVWFYNLILLLFRNTIIKSHTFEVFDDNLIAHFLFTFFLFCSFIIFRVSNYSLCLRNLFIDGLLVENIVGLIKTDKILLWFWFFLYFFSLNFTSIEFQFYLFRKDGFIFLYNGWLVIDMTIAICYNATFSEILKCSCVGSFLHKK